MTHSSLSKLISELKDNVRDKNVDMRHIKSPKKLIHSLQKLNNIIGMTKLKESIASQTRFLIAKLEDGKPSIKMLNTVLYGPPGVGKTKVGVILAEIWANLGFLESVEKKSNIDATINNFTSYMSSDPEGLQMILLLATFIIGYLFAMVKWCFNTFGWITLLILVSLLIFVIFAVWLYNYRRNDDHDDIDNSNTAATCQNSEEPTRPPSSDNDDVITITSRSDFVGQYVGWTARQTEALLAANRGKVLFIDEAYSLLNSNRDEFGMEALTAINKWMSEHPDETVIIFAGYEDKMKRGIFSAQPGLPRRCMWHFNCDTYDGNELTDIFQLQLKLEDLRIAEPDINKVRRLINHNVEAFPSYGGDTERLVFFSQLHQASRPDRVTGIINYSDVHGAIQDLQTNNIKTHPIHSNDNENDHSDLLNQLVSQIH